MNKTSKPEIERRRFPRVMAPVLYRFPKKPAKKQRVSNLSLGGVRVYSDERLEIGQELELEFFLLDGSIVEARARVVWTKELPPGSKGVYDVGMEFIGLSRKARKQLGLILRAET